MTVFPNGQIRALFSVPAINAVIEKEMPEFEYLPEVLKLISGVTNQDVTQREHDLIMGDKRLLMLLDAASDDVKAQMAKVSGWTQSFCEFGAKFAVSVVPQPKPITE
ncbi:hypothetical protein [Pseudoalteromonas umbrosa]|uniref:hypothetical protein n=1 Tax=Pseudoalteromonas umbrosa TaxID=3048489 RepID=UPI0024C310DD|nr:hypothetical protein [Pseudoalteromonas sp. B95]MDK1290175.1 hypothetical protein [Pseudoalteromonas sp. B95]